ncbi:MAG TPA: cytidine deaminase [Fimbriiglobus sp.]|jgi:cytidine deaminase
MSVTDPLLTAATAARNKAVAPYSHFKVGAAVECLDGSIISGCNVESASYGLTMCAERVALFKAVSEGVRLFNRLAVVTDAPTLIAPCGACRQVIWELAGDIEVVMRTLSGEAATVRMSELLPYPFESGQLPQKG